MLAALAVLLIVGGAAAAGLLALRADTRVPVLVAARDIATGEQITAEALSTTPVAAEGTLLIPANRLDELVGTYASSGDAFPQALELVGHDAVARIAKSVASYPLHRWREALDHAHSAGGLGTVKVAFDPRSSQ